MSFNFEWPQFSPEFYDSAKDILAAALNKGETPPIIADKIQVKELNMGTIPPELEILEIGDLSTDRFRGIFRLSYSGDAYIVLQTKVQANPLNVPRPSLDILGTPRILFAAAPLVVPMTLRLSKLSLRAIVVLVVSRQKGITLVFKNDPLESVNVSSSFDGVESVAGYIQSEIEAQLREAFRSDLPSVIHRLSQKWLSGEVKTAAGSNSPTGGFDKDAKIETRTTYVQGGKTRTKGYTTRLANLDLSSNGHGSRTPTESIDLGGSDLDPGFPERIPSGDGSPRRRRPGVDSPWNRGTYARSAPSVASGSTVEVLDSVPESIEHYDPTYGLRPNHSTSKTNFAGYERAAHTSAHRKGLGEVLASDSDEDRSGDSDFDMIALRDLVGDGTELQDISPTLKRLIAQRRGRGQSREHDDFDDDNVELNGLDQELDHFETIPAVGGGTITRPRVFHTQSQMRARTTSNSSLSAHGGSPSTVATARARAGRRGSTSSTIGMKIGSPSEDEDVFGVSRHTSILDDARLEGGFGRASVSNASSARFPFPRVHSSLERSSSLPHLARGSRAALANSPAPSARKPFQSHRSALSSQMSTSGRGTFGSSMGSGPRSSPPSSITSPLTESVTPPEEETVFPPTRPTPIDLLSCSPSSILDNSYHDDSPIIVNPSANDQCARLATLTHSNQTLSPFTRSHEHFTARSTPHVRVANRGSGVVLSNGPIIANVLPKDASGVPVKAKRKRIHRIGQAAASSSQNGTTNGSISPQSRMSPPISTAASGSSFHKRRIPTRSAYAPSLTGSLSRLGSVGAGVGIGRAPSELSDYFPSMSDLGRNAMRRRG